MRPQSQVSSLQTNSFKTTLGRYSARHHRVQRVVLALSGKLLGGPQQVSHGAGQGLLFQNSGSNVGYSLGTTESLVQEALTANLHPGMVAYDLGCNIGFFTMIMGRLVGSDGYIFAFDPILTHTRACAHNADLNGFKNVSMVTAAVGSVNETAELQITKLGTASSLFQEGSDRPTGYLRSEQVQVMTIDAFVYGQGNPPPNFVKMDVEGQGVNAILGMRRTMEEHQPTVLCEMHGNNAQMADLLAELGYATSVLEVSDDLRNAPWWVHFVAKPKAP
jgi:FkbM family methyltransferase